MKKIFFIAFLLSSIMLMQGVSAVQQIWAVPPNANDYCCPGGPCYTNEFNPSQYTAVGADDGNEVYCTNYPFYTLKFYTGMRKESIANVTIYFEKRNGGGYGIGIHTYNFISHGWEYTGYATNTPDGKYNYTLPMTSINDDGNISIGLYCGIQQCDFFMDFAYLDVTVTPVAVCKICDASQLPDNPIAYVMKGICLFGNLLVCQPAIIVFALIFFLVILLILWKFSHLFIR